VLAAAGLLVLSVASPVAAADGVDLQLSVGGVSFGAGSSVVLENLVIANAGTVNATAVVVTIELISTGSSPELTFTPQYNGCTLVNSAEVRCPVPDIAASTSYQSDGHQSGIAVKAIEAHHTAGGPSPVPMAMKAKITVAAQQADVNTADNQVTVDPIMRTVRSGPTDFAARIVRLSRISDTEFDVQAAFLNNGPSQSEIGEMIETVTAPPGTRWEPSSPLSTCAPMIANIEYRCNTQSWIPVGQSAFFEGTLKLTGGQVGTGKVTADNLGGDPNSSNNSAVINLGSLLPASTPTKAPTKAPTAGATATPTPVNTKDISVVADDGAKLARRDTGR
jgi:hypothetical protein